MGRKIILLSDGTGNSAAKVWRTNVWRTFEALDLSGNDQVAFYDDGVGTSSFKPMAILGGAFGLGLRRNVIALYKFACCNYRDPDDELFGFGFSRGGFTIRIVMGLIDSQGLVKADNEAELHSLASAAYRAYRRDRYQNLKFEAPYQWLRNKFGPHYPPQEVRKNVKIRFVGVWDTVGSVGIPEDLARFDILFKKYYGFFDSDLGAHVEHAFHAIALSAVAFSLTIGVLIGAVAGFFGRWTDEGLMRTQDVLQAFPRFVFAMAVAWAMGPGVFTVIVATAVINVPGYARLMRNLMLTARESEYALAAVAVGNTRLRLLWRHLLRNSLIAVVTLVGLSIPYIITGTLVIEQVFNFPGTGLEYFQAAIRNDYEVMLGITVLVGVITVLGNLLADIGYAILDPRIRY